MTTRILVVDDEPDLEALVLQKFRHQIRDKSVSFTFSHDGVEALAALKANGDINIIVAGYGSAANGRAIVAAETAGKRRTT